MAFTYQDMGHAFHEYFLETCFLCCSLLTLLCNRQSIAEYKAYWLMGGPKINPRGVCFTSILSIFSIMAGWIAEMHFMLFFAYITV